MHFNPQIEQLVQQALADTNKGRFAEALAALDQVRKADAQYAASQPEIQLAAGFCLSALGRVDGAISAFAAVANLQPNNLRARLELGRLFRRTGNDASAFVHLNKALEIEPANHRALCQMIEHAMDQGDYEAAQRMLDPLVALVVAGASNDPAVALLFSRLARMVGREEEAAGLLERFDSDASLSPAIRFSISRERGLVADKLQKYDDALRHAAAAHAALPVVHDADDFTERVDKLLGVWGADAVADLPRSERIPGAPEPVFVIGLPGSGTTLVERIIGVHPSAVACGNLPGLRRIADRLDPQPDGARSLVQDPAQLTAELMRNATTSYTQMVGRVLRQLGNGLQPQVVTDKNSYNAFHLPLIASMFPGCRVVHVVRDPRDACLSQYVNQFGLDHSQSSDLYSLGRFSRDFDRTMQHWRSFTAELGVQFLEVSYEALVQSPEELSKIIVEFVGLAWDDECTRFYNARPAARTDCLDEIRRPMHTESVGRHTNYATHLTPLEAGLSGASRPEA